MGYGPTHAKSRVKDLIASWLGNGSWEVLVFGGVFGVLHVGGALGHVWSIDWCFGGLEHWNVRDVQGHI